MRGILTTLSIAAYVVLTGAVLFCVGFAGNALVQANERLATVDADLTSVNGHADPLTYQVQKVNSSLVSIESSLNPLHSQADNLNGILAGVNSTLVQADGTVKDVNSKAGSIEPLLVDSDQKLGFGPTAESHLVGDTEATKRVQLILDQAGQLESILAPAEQDLSNIEGNLKITNDHLASACNKLTVPGLPGIPNVISVGTGC